MPTIGVSEKALSVKLFSCLKLKNLLSSQKVCAKIKTAKYKNEVQSAQDFLVFQKTMFPKTSKTIDEIHKNIRPMFE